ncbi:T9SS-dependent choice-of-anchor J family protein [Aequorivita capsosiphonis]|uniref:T9SS-dependent choice-of-anchor J family protein n=1 Tax=Aequorivita capsosiphonis TaxID=487317 RepID=UPI000427B45B|nr:choice-of-anchor J domain-containing protein [Aequorivita capsosiphonis]
MKKTLLSLALLAGITTMNAQVTIFEDSFEDYEDFTYDNFGEWVQVDLDGSDTWGVTELGDFPNANYVGAGMIFNTTLISPDPGAIYHAYSGDKGLYFFAAGANGTPFPNDDWTISPQISLVGATNAKLSLYAKALTDSYGPDQFEIAVSTTGNSVDDFDSISAMINPGTEYEMFDFDLSDYDGQEIYIAIHCTTNDGLLLMMDDFMVTAETLSTSDFNTAVASIYPNPVVDTFNIDLSSKFDANNVSVTVTDMLGKEVMKFNATNSLNIATLSNGVYMINVTDGNYTATQKIVKK